MPVINIRSGAMYDVYIGRPGPWGNPYRRGTVEQRIEAYRRRIWTHLEDGVLTIEELAALDGKTLGCWCKPGPCHGDVLEAAARWAATR